MNKMKLMIALGACVFAGVVMAGPGRGGPGGHGGHAPRQVHAPGGGGHMARPAARPAPHPAPAHHARVAPPPRPHVGHPPPPRHHFRHHPVGARFWGRPACPPPRFGALRAWTWIASAWNMTVNGVYYYGDGYYFDGYNYYYNGAYYTTPPATTVIVSQTVVF